MTEVKIEYSILSRGTESASGSDGYMAITELYKNHRYILPIPHNVRYAKIDKEKGLHFSAKYSVEFAAFCRFQLISKLGLLKLGRIPKKENILILGSGAIAHTTYIDLQISNFSNIYMNTRREDFKSSLIKDDNIIISLNDIPKFKYIIDTTGNCNILSEVLCAISPGTYLLLLGTPRLGPELNLLDIHRKNLNIIGGHELTGVSNLKRQKIFNTLLKNTINEDLIKNLVHLYKYSSSTRNTLLRKPEKPISIFKYKDNF